MIDIVFRCSYKGKQNQLFVQRNGEELYLKKYAPASTAGASNVNRTAEMQIRADY